MSSPLPVHKPSSQLEASLELTFTLETQQTAQLQHVHDDWQQGSSHLQAEVSDKVLQLLFYKIDDLSLGTTIHCFLYAHPFLRMFSLLLESQNSVKQLTNIPNFVPLTAELFKLTKMIIVTFPTLHRKSL